MTELWFDRDTGPLRQRGALRYAVRADGVWALRTDQLTHPADIAEESAELFGTYGAAAHGIAHLLLGDDVGLPAELERWAVAPDRPAAALGGWQPALITIDGQASLGLTREFGNQRVFASTLGGRHVTGLAPRAAGLSLRTVNSGEAT
jgi:hypothetical protein